MLAEFSMKEISNVSDSKTLTDHATIAKQGGEVAKNTRLELEQKQDKK